VRCAWDRHKAESNASKHGVTFEEAATVLDDDSAVYGVQTHEGEQRLTVIGYSKQTRVLFVVCVERSRDVMRIVSARKATRYEKRKYEEGF
jgi:uncharacterized DUF497 family protein